MEYDKKGSYRDSLYPVITLLDKLQVCIAKLILYT